MVTSVRDHNMYLQNESTGESNECICSPSSLLSAEQMKTIGAHASGGCSPPSATVPSALPLTSSLGLDSGAGCCTVWTLTRGAGTHVTLSWLDTSEKHWCWKIYDFLFSCIHSSRLAKRKYFHKDITVFLGLQKSFHWRESSVVWEVCLLDETYYSL